MISILNYLDFMRAFNAGEFGPQRLGQAFCNKFYPDQAMPDLFYETGRARALEMINTLVNWD